MIHAHGKNADEDEEKTSLLQHQVNKQFFRMGAELQQQRRRMMHFILTHVKSQTGGGC